MNRDCGGEETLTRRIGHSVRSCGECIVMACMTGRAGIHVLCILVKDTHWEIGRDGVLLWVVAKSVAVPIPTFNTLRLQSPLGDCILTTTLLLLQRTSQPRRCVPRIGREADSTRRSSRRVKWDIISKRAPTSFVKSNAELYSLAATTIPPGSAHNVPLAP